MRQLNPQHIAKEIQTSEAAMSEFNLSLYPLVSLKCDWCEQRFGGAGALRQHVVAKHNIGRCLCDKYNHHLPLLID